MSYPQHHKQTHAPQQWLEQSNSVFRHNRAALACIHGQSCAGCHVDSRPKFWIYWLLGSNPPIGSMRNWVNVFAQIIENEVIFTSANDQHEVMFARCNDDFSEQQRTRRPTTLEQLVTLGNRIIFAVPL